MTDAGFSGCAVALVPRDAGDGVIGVVVQGHRHRTGGDPACYPTRAAGGVEPI